MRLLRTAAICVAAACIVGVATAAAVGWHEGYRIYVVHTGSMTPALNPGDAVLDRPAPAAVHQGEVVTFGVNSGPDSVVTHRVNAVAANGIKTKGDANPTPDPWTVQFSDVIGTKFLTLPYGGYVLVYLQHPQGIASVLTALFAMILLWHLFFPPEAITADSATRPRHRHRYRREPTPDDSSRELDELSPAFLAPASRWLDVTHPAPVFLRSSAGPLGRPADRRSYFE